MAFPVRMLTAFLAWPQDIAEAWWTWASAAQAPAMLRLVRAGDRLTVAAHAMRDREAKDRLAYAFLKEHLLPVPLCQGLEALVEGGVLTRREATDYEETVLTNSDRKGRWKATIFKR